MCDFETVERRYRWLVLHIIDRYFAPGLDRDDLIQEGTIGLWKAHRDFDGSGDFRAFAGMVIERHLITVVKTALRGKHQPLNTAMDLDSRPGQDAPDGPCLGDVIAAPDCAAHEVAERRDDLRDLQQRMGRLSAIERDAVLLMANGGTYTVDGRVDKRVDNALQRARAKLGADQPAVVSRQHGVLLVDRTAYPTERDAIRAAGRVRPGCKVLAVHMRKVRRGRVVAPQGRPAADGSLGRPVWAVEIDQAA